MRFAPNVYFLALFRMVQGLGGAAGMGMSRSIARDLHSGVALVKFFSALTVVTGLGPLIAPQIGSAILTFTSWRGIFIALAVLGAVLLWSAWLRVPETLPERYRSHGSVWSTPGSFVRIGRDRVFLSLALTYGFGMAGVFVYAAGSSFVLQNVYGLSPQVYAAVFAAGGCGWILGAQVNGRLVGRFRARGAPDRRLRDHDRVRGGSPRHRRHGLRRPYGLHRVDAVLLVRLGFPRAQRHGAGPAALP